MTVTVAKYLALIPPQNANKPNFTAMVAAVAQCLVDIQNVDLGMPAAFDIDNAWGDRLDTLGEFIGLSRNLAPVVPGIYLQAPLGSTPLSDADYQIALEGKIHANQWDGTINSAYNLLQSIVGPQSTLFMIDNLDMSMVTCIAGQPPDASLQATLAGGYFQIRPAGVLSNYYFPTAPGGPLFGLDVENQYISGLDVGVWAYPITGAQ